MAGSAGEKTVRLADVAKAAQVSQGTVSNVFNRPDLVREEVREHVREVARGLGYRGPDPKGRLLRAGKVNAIGVVTGEALSYFFEDPFARVLMTGITEACDARGAGISLVSAANEDDLAWNVRNALVDGFVLFCLGGGERLVQLTRERQLPFVALALGIEDETIPAVGIDNIAGGRLVGRHLSELGHERFALLTLEIDRRGEHGPVSLERVRNARFIGSRDRTQGFMEALEAAGIDISAVPIFETQRDEAAVHEALEQLFAAPEPPTAIFAHSDRIALMALTWLKARGISVPGDVSVVGFDGIPESMTSEPPLTTVVQPIAEIGRRAAQMILDPERGPHHLSVDVRLVPRGSSAAPKG